MDDSIPIGTLDFNTDDVKDQDVHDIAEKIRELDGLVVFESGFSGQYTIARKED